LPELKPTAKNWRTRLQPIRTASEIIAHIKILPAIRIPLYQKLAQKVEELIILGMPLRAIANNLKLSLETIKRTRKYSASLRVPPTAGRSNLEGQAK